VVGRTFHSPPLAQLNAAGFEFSCQVATTCRALAHDLVGRSAAAQVESGSSGERIFLRRSPTDQARCLLNPKHSPTRHLGEDVFALLLGERHCKRRLRERWSNAINGDVVAGEFLGETLRQRDLCRLRGAVGAVIRIALLPGYRRDIDDPSVPVTLVRSARPGSRIVDEEPFGPVLPIIPYDSIVISRRNLGAACLITAFIAPTPFSSSQ
jgi:hypothetical protein